MRKTEVIEKVNSLCKEYNINSYPVKIVELCETLGIKVFEQYLPKDVSGFIVAQKKEFQNYGSDKVIVVNLSDSARRRRFTIAHELGHFILHRREEDELYAHRDAGDRGTIEVEADWFASALLMPENLVEISLDGLKDHWGEIIPFSLKAEHIADDFAVSLSAATVRLEQLGIRRGV